MSVLFAGGNDAPEPEPLHLWPCNAKAWQCWTEVQTQWCTDQGVRLGLAYAGVRAHLDECGLEGDERKEIYEGIRAAEQGALRGWAERRAIEEAKKQ